MDRAELQFAGKGAARGVANPTAADFEQIKRIGRYLKRRPRACHQFYLQAPRLFLRRARRQRPRWLFRSEKERDWRCPVPRCTLRSLLLLYSDRSRVEFRGVRFLRHCRGR